MILIVDDDEAMRQAAAAVLEDAGFGVVCAQDGMEAIGMYRSRCSEIHLVICDIMMPNLGGVETFQNLKAINPEVAVIFASGFLSNRTRILLNEQGARGFLHKPYSSSDILTAVRSVLGGSPSP